MDDHIVEFIEDVNSQLFDIIILIQSQFLHELIRCKIGDKPLIEYQELNEPMTCLGHRIVITNDIVEDLKYEIIKVYK